MKNWMKPFCIFMLAMILVSSAAFAASPWKEQGGSYGDMTKNKLDFGIRNLLGGWTELLTEPVKANNIGTGLGKGLYNAVIFTTGGLLHTVTFPATTIDIPLPDNGVQLGK